MLRNLTRVSKVAIGGSFAAYHMKSSHCNDIEKSLEARVNAMKRRVGYKVIDDYVQSGMVVGIGTGTTTYFAVERLAQKLKRGDLKDVTLIPTSEEFKKLAASKGIPVRNLNTNHQLDLMLDSANEVDSKLNIIKGGTGAILREKMAILGAEQYICIVDETKLTRAVGPHWPVAVEVTPYCHEFTKAAIEDLPGLKGCKAVLRRGSLTHNFPDGTNIAVTDNGNYIYDVYFSEPIADVHRAVHQLDSLSGVVEHGLITSIPDPDNHGAMPGICVLVGTKDGCRLAGGVGEEPWWKDKPFQKPHDRRTIDNRGIN